MASVGFALSSTLRTGFVEAGVCLVRRRALAGGGGRESPRRARYFSLLRQRKVPKRKAIRRVHAGEKVLYAPLAQITLGNLQGWLADYNMSRLG